jgi:hypothetical protein
MKTAMKLAILGFLASSSLPSMASASEGVLDFVDPCIEAHDQFNDQRDQILGQLNQQLANVDAAKSTDEYRKLWMESKKKALRPYFDANVKPVLESAGVKDFDQAYNKWFELQLGQLTPDQLASLQDANFRLELKAFLLDRRGKTAAALEEQHQELSKSCKMDVGNQVLRVALLGALKPITLIGDSWKSAEKDGFLAQLISAGTGGINPVDVFRCPIRGCSSESVFNKTMRQWGIKW